MISDWSRLCAADSFARVNIGNALVYKLPADLHLHGSQINVALSIFFVSYILFDVPATVAMKLIRPHVSCESSNTSRQVGCDTSR